MIKVSEYWSNKDKKKFWKKRLIFEAAVLAEKLLY